ncbi:MAG: hypothetical protein FWG74_01695 [Planctomycetes bacterium]|nr:hypothetical protein [Planctomycetota bacterium]
MGWSFADILGQDETLERLSREFSAGRLAHAYLLEGMAGTGRLTLARGMAGLIFCRNPDPTGRICGSCRPCLLLVRGNHPDYLELPRDPAELRIGRFLERQGGSETVEHKPLLPFLRLKPVEGGRRVAVIPDAERMRTEAANAFLKTLEEPPGQALILLTVNSRDRLPATVSSRCRRIGVRPLSAGLAAAELARRDAALGEDAMTLALAAEGSLGKALELSGGDVPRLWRWLEREAFNRPGAVAAKSLADAWLAHGPKGGDGQGKRKSALAALDLSALVLRRRLREGLAPEKAALALAALWNAGDQVMRNVRPDLALLSAAFEVMAALR